MERRTFLKAAAAVGATSLLPVSAMAVSSAMASSSEAATLEDPGVIDSFDTTPKQWGFVIDAKKIEKLDVMDDMIEVCNKAHNIPQTGDPKTEVKWIWAEPFENTFADMENEYMGEETLELAYPVLCNHCDNPPCVRVCPTKATFKRSDGIVMMDPHRCIGCRFCMGGCPYGARSLNFFDPRLYLDEINPDYPTRTKGVVEKCTLCAERIDKGEIPLCVEALKGAILFGDLNDPDSEVSRALREAFFIRRRTNLGTGPNMYYIVSGGAENA